MTLTGFFRSFTIFVLVVAFLSSPFDTIALGDDPNQLLNKGIPYTFNGRDSENVKLQSFPATKIENSTFQIPLGDPGFTLHPIGSIGHVTEGYLEDTQHIFVPYAIATIGDTVWIADTYGERAVHYQADGTFINKIGKAGYRYSYSDQTVLETVFDVATDSSGNVYLLDREAAHVAVFNSDGLFIFDIGENFVWGDTNYTFVNPQGLVVDNNGFIYVSDSGNCRIQVYSSNGSYITTIGETGVCASDNGHFSATLRHLDIYNNQLFVADAENHRIQIFDISDPQLNISYVSTLGVTGVSGDDVAHFNWPTGVAVDSNHLYVADMHNQRVQIFNQATKEYQATLSGPSTNDNFLYPSDVESDSNGNLYVADNGHYRVVQYNSSLNFIRNFGVRDVPYLTDLTHFNRLSGVAVGLSGNIYAVEEYGCRLLILDENGGPITAIGEAGIAGDDNLHFNSPNGVAVSPLGEIYVADTGNNRIQIFSSNGYYLRTKGSFGIEADEFSMPYAVAFGANKIFVADTGNSRVQVFDSNFNYLNSITGFQTPRDIAVGLSGNIYVLDLDYQAILVYDQNYNLIRTIGGVEGSSWTNYAALDYPTALAIDTVGHLYVSAGWGSHIVVFDENGAFLTSYGEEDDRKLGQFRQIEGLTVDTNGLIYVAERLSHRIQLLEQGVTGWRQANINGFGNARINQIPSMAVHNGELFAGVYYQDETSVGHSDLYYSQNGKNWTQVGFDFGDGLSTLISYKGNLYAGTWNGQLWRSADGKSSWSKINSDWQNFADSNSFATLVEFDDYLYATTWNEESGTQIWRSNTGNSGMWTCVVDNGFGASNAYGTISKAVFNGQLYLGVVNTDDEAGFISKTINGIDWEKVGEGEFHSGGVHVVSALSVFNNSLYAYVFGENGSQIWSSMNGSTWQLEFTIPDLTVGDRGALEVLNGNLYLVVGNSEDGLEVWYTKNGSDWNALIKNGINGVENVTLEFDSSATIFNNALYFGDINYSNGAIIWNLQQLLYLPLMIR